MGTGGSPENLAHIYKIARCHNAEDRSITTKETSALPPKPSHVIYRNNFTLSNFSNLHNIVK